MISLTGGNVQTLAGVAVPGGSLTLQLNSDAVVIATPGFVPSAYLATFKFDSTANLAGSCKIWSNFELNPPGTQYLVTFKDANGSRISNQIWQFTQSSGASVDIGTIIPVAPASSSAALPFSSVAANLFFGGPASGAAAFPTFRALVAADIAGLSPSFAALTVVGNLTAASANIPSLNTAGIFQSAATLLQIIDNQSGVRLSIPANGIGQGTLNNWKLTGPSSANSVTLVNFQGPASPITGTGAAATIYTFSVPANTIGAGKGIRVTTAFNHSTGSASVTYVLSFGGTAIASYNSSVAGYGRVITDIFNTTGSTTAQSIDNGHLMINTSLVTGGGGSSAITTTANQSVTFTFSVANTDQVAPVMFRIELIQ